MNTGIHLIFFSQGRQAPQSKTQTNLIPLIKMILFSMSSMYLSTTASISDRWRNKWRCDTKLKKKKLKTKTKKKCPFHTSCPPSPIAFCPGLCFYRDFGCASCRTGPYCDLSCGFWLDALGSWPRILSCRRPPATDFCLFFPVKNFNQHQDHYDWRILSERSKKGHQSIICILMSFFTDKQLLLINAYT